ncbi:hypothetical protein V6N13_105461 [Hibiscus sabdariffa]|uniref:Uncharacterized protein n=1 Tax=Hibiscus sabdariffa TaxID=183260 RepID=A0ABR2EWY1_9ROSI
MEPKDASMQLNDQKRPTESLTKTCKRPPIDGTGADVTLLVNDAWKESAAVSAMILATTEKTNLTSL